MAKKRGNNDGTVRQRKDGTWEARVTLGFGPDGKQRRKSFYAATQAEVQSKMRAALSKIEQGDYSEPSKITLSSWLDTWFATYGLPHWRSKTAEVHRDNIRLHLKPALGRITLVNLRPDHIQGFINAQQKAGFSAPSIRKQLEPLKGALKQAVDNRLIPRNPAYNVKLPPNEQREIDFLLLDEQKALLAVLPDSTQGRAIRFILGTGLRASELCGLRWTDIEKDSFTVRQSAQYVRDVEAKEGTPKQKLSIAGTKTKAGRRTIPLTSSMAALLETQRKAQMTARLAAGPAWLGGQAGEGKTPVFATEYGTVYDRSNLSRTLRLCLSKAGLKSRGLHALRHTFATNWVRSGADLRTLSEILGHTKVALTMQLYVHSDIETKKAGLLAVESML